jgi:hypothetical protein
VGENLVNKNELIAALEAISPGVSTKNIVQEYACVSFNGNSISSFSESVFVIYPIDIPNINCLVEHNVLLEMLRKIPDKQINLFQTENELVLKTDKIESYFTIIEREHPSIELPNKIYDMPSNLMEAIKMCSFSVSKDISVPSVTCIHIDGLNVISTDTKRITRFRLDSESPFNFHIPLMVIETIKTKKFCKMAEKDNFIYFIDDNNTYFAFYQLSLDRKFISDDVEKFLNKEGFEVIFPKDFIKVIDRASVMTEGLIPIDFIVDIKLENGKFEVSSRKQSGRFIERGDIDYFGETVRFKASAPFLKDVLSKTNKAIISDVCLFKDKDFDHVMVLLRD